MMALLTGQNESTIHKTCNPKRGYDNCDFIWREFQEQGYKTAYAEDTALNSTFNIKSPGFKVPPTDYYFRPMSLAIEKTFKKTTKNGISYCIGNRQYGEYVYEMGLRFAKRFRNRPYFGLFRTKSFSHGDYSLPATMDLKLLNYFKEMEIVGIFDHAIVFFFSDCGLLPSPLDKLPEGLLEERLPTFFISIPKWFRGNYWNLVRKLEANCQRLTSPYDIYMTMQHLLQIDLINSTMKQATGCLQ
uniref:Sulfatase N-terminal domain-containing protein n=1 Tax=Glossina brevipalpis TaxID=37001 RepID=A0A1A9W131_9MUSC